MRGFGKQTVEAEVVLIAINPMTHLRIFISHLYNLGYGELEILLFEKGGRESRPDAGQEKTIST